MFWGLSPALDLQKEYLQHEKEITGDLNILLIGSCDARHIIKTLAQAYRHKRVNINIFVIEGCLELIARQLMLLSIALENPNRLGLLEKTRLYMEIYGNALLRPSTSKYMMSKARQLIEMITNLDYMTKIMPYIKIDALKYKERDYIEMLLQFWVCGYTNQFDICQFWDKRVRKSLGARYDNKTGVFDWDYNMRLKDIGGDTVCCQEYQYFRKTGIAFVWLETEAHRPNCTLAAGVIKTGDKFYHREYIGDIVTGPFIAYGLECEAKNMLKKTNGIYLKRATDISERNLLQYFYELLYKCPFDSNIVKHQNELNLGAVTILQSENCMSSETEVNVDTSDRDVPIIDLDFTEISFHSPTALSMYPKKSSYNKKFNLMFVSHNYVQYLNPSVFNLVNDNGVVIFETQKFVLDYRKKDIKEHFEKIKTIMEQCSCISVGKCDPLEECYAKFVINRP